MLQKLHKNAKTNYAIRREIQSSPGSISFLARKHNLSWLTVKKWKEREFVKDKSSRPEKLRISLTRYQEDVILFERKKFKKSIEEIYLT
ncbi:IS481 family transposase, partial [Candidatus Roizmanbacteria bacterium CG01_land_8_20_14_3_00_33_9]